MTFFNPLLTGDGCVISKVKGINAEDEETSKKQGRERQRDRETKMKLTSPSVNPSTHKSSKLLRSVYGR